MSNSKLVVNFRIMKKFSRCVIIGAAQIENYQKIKTFLKPETDFYVFCDGGLNHEAPLGIKPNLIIGDFDSHEKPNIEENGECQHTQIIALPREKDDTDVFYAVKQAVGMKFKDFLLVGVIGNRFDHSMVNISVLQYLSENGLEAKIIDDYSEMEVLENRKEYSVGTGYSFFSLMTLSDKASGIFIEDAKFPLRNGKIHASYQYGISNEVLPGKTSKIRVKKGKVLLIKVW